MLQTYTPRSVADTYKGSQLPWILLFCVEKLKAFLMPPKSHRHEAIKIFGIPINSAIVITLVSYGALGIWYGAITWTNIQGNIKQVEIVKIETDKKIEIVEKKVDKALESQALVGERLAKIESTGGYTLDAISRIEKKLEDRR